MAWTTPRTWTTGEVVTAAVMNAHLRDNLNFLYSPPSARVYHNAAQSATSGVDLDLALNSERWDTDTMHDTVTNNSRLTCVTEGRYLIVGNIQWATNGTGIRRLGIELADTTVLARVQAPAGSGFNIIQNVGCIYPLAVSDYVELVAHQTSGAGLNVDSQGFYSPEFAAHWMGN